jgi:hypothetical protein
MGEFAKTTEAKYEDGYIRFTWKEAGEPRLFEISGEALMQSFGAADDSGKELMDAFERGRKHIADASLAVEISSRDHPLDAPNENMAPLNRTHCWCAVQRGRFL